MPSSIQDRLKKVPPFDDDIPVIRDLKHAKEQEAPQEEEKEEPKEEVVEEVVSEQVEEPKEEPKDRTKEQFDKLKEHNKQLNEENKVLRDNVLESLKPKEQEPFLPQVPNTPDLTPQVVQKIEDTTKDLKPDAVDDIYAKLIDENGYIDPDLLIRTLREANDGARQARAEADEARKMAQSAEKETQRKFRDFEESREVRRVHKKYPQIDPKSKDFNELFWDDVRKEIATAPILRGENVGFMEAADKIWNQRYTKEVDEVKKADKEKINQAENAKRNINATRVGTSRTDDYSPADDEALKQAVIQNKRGALAERLKRAGY